MRGGITKPGGHFKEIQQLQRGLKKDITRYNKLCRGGGGGGGDGGQWSPIPRGIDETANRPVEKPVIIVPTTRITPEPIIRVPPIRFPIRIPIFIP